METTKSISINNPFLFLLAELSLSSQFIAPFNPVNLPDISYYANRQGELIPIIAGSTPQGMYNHIYLFGVNVDGHLHPIFDNRRRWILVNRRTGQTIIVSRAFYYTYRHKYPANIISQLVIRNNGEFVMPRRPRSRSHNLPANGRRGHN